MRLRERSYVGLQGRDIVRQIVIHPAQRTSAWTALVAERPHPARGTPPPALALEPSCEGEWGHLFAANFHTVETSQKHSLVLLMFHVINI